MWGNILTHIGVHHTDGSGGCTRCDGDAAIRQQSNAKRTSKRISIVAYQYAKKPVYCDAGIVQSGQKKYRQQQYVLIFPALVLGYESINVSMNRVPVPTYNDKFV